MKVNIYNNITHTKKHKNYYWYINTITAVYMTYNLCFYIIADLNLVYKLFKIADDCKT